MKVLKTLGIILFFGLFLRVHNLSAPDMISDDATYSYRSVAYIDYMAAVDRQSTPVTWFESAKWWQGLSFHDAPPLVFITQWLSFRVFGVNQFAARIPFVLFGMLSIIALYLLGREIGGEEVGKWAAILAAISNITVWLSRIGYLDGYLILFISLSIYFFLRAKHESNNYIYWGICLGLGLLTKYTFLFMGPVFLMAIIFTRRDAIKNKKFYLGLLIALALISPLIAYNYGMYRDRGHLDAPLSTMLGQSPADFNGLRRTTTYSPATVFKDAYRENSFSVISIILAALGLIILAKNKQEENKESHFIIVNALIWGIITLSSIAGSGHMLAIVVPSLIVLAAGGLNYLENLLKTRGYMKERMLLVCFVILFEVLITFQSQILTKPILNNKILISDNGSLWRGYSNLETFVGNFYDNIPGLSTLITISNRPQLAERQRAWLAHDLASSNRPVGQPHLLVYDDRMDWFATFWIFDRRELVERQVIHSMTNFLKHTNNGDSSYYSKLGISDVTFIIKKEDGSPTIKGFERVAAASKKIEYKIKPKAVILDQSGKEAFFVYYSKL